MPTPLPLDRTLLARKVVPAVLVVVACVTGIVRVGASKHAVQSSAATVATSTVAPAFSKPSPLVPMSPDQLRRVARHNRHLSAPAEPVAPAADTTLDTIR